MLPVSTEEIKTGHPGETVAIRCEIVERPLHPSAAEAAVG